MINLETSSERIARGFTKFDVFLNVCLLVCAGLGVQRCLVQKQSSGIDREHHDLLGKWLFSARKWNRANPSKKYSNPDLRYFTCLNSILSLILTSSLGRVKVTLMKKIEIKTLLNMGLSERQVARFSGVSKKCVCGDSNKLRYYPLQQLMIDKGQLRQYKIVIYCRLWKMIEHSPIKYWQLSGIYLVAKTYVRLLHVVVYLVWVMNVI